MDPIAEIERARKAQLVDEDSYAVELVVEPPAHQDEIAALEQELGLPLPRELRALLQHTKGLDGVLDIVDFTGRTLDVALEDSFLSGLPIAADGYGNFWVADLTPHERDVARVFFACHDAPVILFQSPSIGHFLHEAFRMLTPPHASLVDDVHEDRLHNVYRTNPGVISHDQAQHSEDEALIAFAATLDDDFEIVDLRDAPIGMGLSWGRYGPRTELRRHGYERVFAYRRPPERPKRSRLFSRR
jgi:cell wall assembly regulator SMI1